MNYRHAYHAGNFADVFKHAVLIVLLRALAKKETPFFVLDAHGGPGRYLLQEGLAAKRREYENGVARLAPRVWSLPELADYRQVIAAHDPEWSPGPAGKELAVYPGSPLIIRHFLRAQDRLAALELHAEDSLLLKQELRGDKRAGVHQRDSYDGLRALVPPKERRGLVLLDPSYEQPDELQRLFDALREAHAKWPAGVYAVWYPIKSVELIARFRRSMQRSGIRKIFAAELDRDVEPPELSGTGMMVVNPPWKTDESIARLTEILTPALGANPKRSSATWWVPE